MNYFRKIFFLSLSLLAFFSASATHNRAGEITYRYLGGFTYEVTIITYTRTSSFSADRPQLDSVYWGDGSQSVFVRVTGLHGIDIGNDITLNKYINRHTYAGNGSFLIHFEDPNRNEGVINIPFSVNVPFYISTLLVINQVLGPNSSPVLNYAPIDRGCVNRVFIHNPIAVDPEGDSLSYELTTCRGENGLPIPGYTFPSASHSFSIDPMIGDLTWDSPLQAGEYNVAFKIIEWRSGVQIGYVTRDMQIIIAECENQPPQIQSYADTCVVAGDSLAFDVTAIDPDRNLVILSSSGAPYTVRDSAVFRPVTQNNDTVVSHFFWQTSCHHIRNQPYYVQFKAQDVVPADSISLVYLTGIFIRVIGPAPLNPVAAPNGNAIDLNWNPPVCTEAIGYRIYRRTGLFSGSIQCPCENGVPSGTGYTLLDTTMGLNNTSYLDDNHGPGLVIGVEYCYLITAIYPDGSESCATNQVCSSLKKDLPVLTNADVRTTDPANGSIYTAWSKPTELDTILYPGPYEYRLYHSADFFGTSFSLIATKNDLNDTTFIDSLLDTRSHAWSYKVELYYTNSGNLTSKGNSTTASSVFLSISPTDNRLILSWEEHVPWINYRYDIFRLNSLTSLYDSIGTSNVRTFTDSNLVNLQTYCYYIRSTGSYYLAGFIDPIINRSQQECARPLDNVPPCAPLLDVKSFCLDDLNRLTWNNPNLSCADDVMKYYIYYAATELSGFERIDSVLIATDTVYDHQHLLSLAGCYKITAIDSTGNESLDPVSFCVDTCRQYVLPSVFTPNGDGNNDFFHPCDSTTALELQLKNCPPYKNVKNVEMKIFNRWGNLVYKTEDKNINWDGKLMSGGSDCPDGVYYYTCKVNFYRVAGVETVDLNGFVHLIRNK